jgi:hypothetical protein
VQRTLPDGIRSQNLWALAGAKMSCSGPIRDGIKGLKLWALAGAKLLIRYSNERAKMSCSGFSEIALGTKSFGSGRGENFSSGTVMKGL